MQGDPGLQSATARVDIASESFEVPAGVPFVFGRADSEGVVGLDANDMGISAIAGSLEAAWGVWWVVNQSKKRPLLLEHPVEPNRLTLAPGHRHALTTDRVDVLVPGAIFTHVLAVSLPDVYVSQLRAGIGRLSTGTLTEVRVSLTPADRLALVGLCAGYLESFPVDASTPTPTRMQRFSSATDGREREYERR